MRVLVCGSRTYDDRPTMFREMLALTKEHGASNLTLIHGAAKGADSMAAAIATQLQWDLIVPFPADWERYGRSAGAKRNKQMLVEGKPDHVIAFKDKPNSVGTDMMIRFATEAHVRTTVFDVKDPS